MRNRRGNKKRTTICKTCLGAGFSKGAKAKAQQKIITGIFTMLIKDVVEFEMVGPSLKNEISKKAIAGIDIEENRRMYKNEE